MRAYKLSSELRVDLGRLYDKIGSMTEEEVLLLQGISEWITKTEKATWKQLSVLGRLYKRYLQDGEYVHHNWTIWD